MTAHILAIDQGTTGTTVALMDARGVIAARATVEFPQHYPRPGWVEHDPEEIWRSVQLGIKRVLQRGVCRASQIAAVGLTNQRETTVLWHRDTGEPLCNAVVWQCRRTTDFTEALKASGQESAVRERTGLRLDPYFSASKFRWQLRHAPGAGRLLRSGKIAAGTVDSFLLWRLTAGAEHVTDVSNASRTSLLNLRSAQWDNEMLSLFEVPASILPRIVPSSGVLGHTRGVRGLPDGIPIAGVAGDQQAALFGQACFNTGDAKCTFGTGSFILMNRGTDAAVTEPGLLSSIAWQLGAASAPVYCLEGGAFVCGAAVQWLRDGLGLLRRSSDVEALAASVSDHGGVEFVPALTGLGAPHWAPEARGMLAGLTRGTTAAHIARATLDAMALQNRDILVAMERQLARRMRPLRVDGGAAANDLLMQIQADVLGRKLIRPVQLETTVAGASYLAGLGVGLWRSTREIRSIWQAEREFTVRLSAAARRTRCASWEKALQRALL